MANGGRHESWHGAGRAQPLRHSSEEFIWQLTPSLQAVLQPILAGGADGEQRKRVGTTKGTGRAEGHVSVRRKEQNWKRGHKGKEEKRRGRWRGEKEREREGEFNDTSHTSAPLVFASPHLTQHPPPWEITSLSNVAHLIARETPKRHGRQAVTLSPRPSCKM